MIRQIKQEELFNTKKFIRITKIKGIRSKWLPKNILIL